MSYCISQLKYYIKQERGLLWTCQEYFHYDDAIVSLNHWMLLVHSLYSWAKHKSLWKQ